jgi:hypothetical protein
MVEAAGVEPASSYKVTLVYSGNKGTIQKGVSAPTSAVGSENASKPTIEEQHI